MSSSAIPIFPLISGGNLIISLAKTKRNSVTGNMSHWLIQLYIWSHWLIINSLYLIFFSSLWEERNLGIWRKNKPSIFFLAHYISLQSNDRFLHSTSLFSFICYCPTQCYDYCFRIHFGLSMRMKYFDTDLFWYTVTYYFGILLFYKYMLIKKSY